MPRAALVAVPPTPQQLRERVRLMRARSEITEAIRSVGEALAIAGSDRSEAASLMAVLNDLWAASRVLDLALADLGA